MTSTIPLPKANPRPSERVTTYAAAGDGSRMSACDVDFQGARLRVLVDPCFAEHNDAARALAAEIAERFEPEPAPESDGLVQQAARLFCNGSLLGKHVSAGRNTPAVPSAFGWCVLNLQGSPLAFCHDAIDALIWFHSFEAMSPTDREDYAQHPIESSSDDENEAADAHDRRIRLRLLGYHP